MSKSTDCCDTNRIISTSCSANHQKENLGCGASGLEIDTLSPAILSSSIVPKLIELIHSIAKASQVQKSQSDCGSSSDSMLFVAPFDLQHFSLQFQHYLAHNFWPNRSFDRLVQYVTQQNVSFGVMEGLLQHLKLNLQLSFKFFALINISTKCTTKLEALTFALANYKLNNFIADCSNDEQKLILFLEDEVALCFIGKNYEKICQICESNSAMKKCLDPLLPLFRAPSSPTANLSRDYANIFESVTDLGAIKHPSRQEIEAFLDESAHEISAKSHICYNSLLMVCNNCPSAESIAIIIYYFATHLKTTINPELSTTFHIEFEAYNSSRFFAYNKDEVLSCISKLSREFPELSQHLFSHILVLHRTPRTDPFLYSGEQLQFFLDMLSQFKDLVPKFVCHIFEQQWSSCIEDQTRQLSIIYYLTQHSEILRKLSIKGFDLHRERAKNHLLWPKQFFTVLFRLYLQNLNNHLKFSILSILKFIILNSCKNIAANNLASLINDIVNITNSIIKDIEAVEVHQVQTNDNALFGKDSSSQSSAKKSELIDLIYWCSQKFVASILCSENLNNATCLLALQQILKNSRQFEFSIFSGILQYLNYSTKIPNKTLSNSNSIRLSCQLFDKIFDQRNAADEKSGKCESNSSLIQLKYLFIDSLPKPFMYMIGLFIFSKDLDSIEQLLKFQYECYGSSSICNLLEFLSNELQISEECETVSSESKDVEPCKANIDRKAQTSELFEGKDNSNSSETPKTIKVRSEVIGAAVFKKILTFLSDYLTDIQDEKIRFQISDFLSKSNAYIFSDETSRKKTSSISDQHLFESQNIIELRQLLDSIFKDNEFHAESSGNKQTTGQIGTDNHSEKSSDRLNKFATAFFDKYYSILEKIESSHCKACDTDKQFDRSLLMHCLHEASLIFIITKSQFSLLHSSQSVLKKIVTILNKFMLHSKKSVDKKNSDANSSSDITQENNSNIQYLLDFIKHCFTQNVPLSLLVFASLILLNDLSILKRNIENLSIFEFVINSQNFTLLESNIQKLIIDEYNEWRKKNKSSNSTSSQYDENIDEKLNKKALCKSLEAKINPKFIFTVQFIFNNLTLGNLGKKVEEFDSRLLDLPLKQDLAAKKTAIDEGHDESNKNIKSTDSSEILDCLSSRVLWLAIYLVRHRASEEPDCQHLYLNFIFASKMSAKLEQECKKQAIEFIHQCLSCNRIFFDTVVKRRFENIGQFLSQMTLQRNIPILQSNLALDALLHECNLKGIQEVEIVIPFVIKIIEPCIDKAQSNQVSDSRKSKNDNQILMMLFGGRASNDPPSQPESDTFCYEQQKKSMMSEVFENEFPSMSSASVSRDIKSEKMVQDINSGKKATLIDSDVLESTIPCIFDLPNPWTYSILSMVAEIYHYYQKSMKVGLQTQIEKFFKSIPVDFNELQLLQILTTVPFLEKQLYLPSKYLNIKSLALSHQRFTNAHGSRSNSNEGLSGKYLNQNLAPKPSQPLKSLHFVKQQSVMPDYSLLLSLQRYNNELPQTNGNFVVNNDSIFGDNSEQNQLKYNKLFKMLVVPHQSAAFQSLIQFTANSSSHNQNSGKSNLNEVIIESMVKGVQSIIYPICVKTQNTVMTTCLMMAYKDFFQINSITDSGDDFLAASDVTNIRNQVAELVQYLSASLTLITCEEGVIPSLALCLKSALLRQFSITNSAQRHQIECGIMAIIHKNFLIVTKFIQESVVESCLKELDNFFYSFFTPKMQSQLFQNRYNEKSSDPTKLNATNNNSQNELLTHVYLSLTAPATNMAVTYEKDDKFATKLLNNGAIGLSSEQGMNGVYKQCSKLSSQMYRKVYINMANNSKDDPNVTHAFVAGQSQNKLTSELDSEINMTGTFSDSQVQGTTRNPGECSRVIYERVKDLISKLQAAFPSLNISSTAYETPINSPHNLTRSDEFSLSKNASSANSAKKHSNNSIFSSDGASNVILLSTAIDKFFQANQCEEMAVALCQRAINCLLEPVPSANIHRTYQTSIIKSLKLLSNPQLIYPINSSTILLAIKRIPDSRCLDFHFIDLILRNKLITPKHFDELIMHYFDMRILTHVEFLLGLLKRILIDMPIDGLVFQRDFRATQNILMKFAAADPQRRSDSIKAVLAQLMKKPAAVNQKSLFPTLVPQSNSSHEDLAQNVNSSNMTMSNKTLAGSTLSALFTQQPAQLTSINDNDSLGGNQSASASHGSNKDFPKGKNPDEIIESLLREWIHMFQSQDALRNPSILNSTYHLRNLSKFISKLNSQGMLKSDALMSYFFQTSIELCIKDATSKLAAENIGRHNDGIAIPVDRSLRNVVKDKCFYVLDALVGLIILLIKYSGERLTVIKVSMLHKIMKLIVICLSNDSNNFAQKLKAISINKDHRNSSADISSSTSQNYGNSMAYKNAYFHPLPYYRMMYMIFFNLNMPDSVFDSINIFLLMTFSDSLLSMPPRSVPAFAFYYLELIGNPLFIEKMLDVGTESRDKCWNMYSRLLNEVFKFVSKIMSCQRTVNASVLTFYKALLRLLLIMLHDFPDFICDYYYTFCDNISLNCLQLRNLILSAFPRSINLPCPYESNRYEEFLANMSHVPNIVHSYSKILNENKILPGLEKFLNAKLFDETLPDFQNVKMKYFADLLQIVRSSIPSTSSKLNASSYNLPLINALVIYIAHHAISTQILPNIDRNTPQQACINLISSLSHSELFAYLLSNLDDQGKYLMLGSMVNHLRYPNPHTFYFSQTILYLFLKLNSVTIKEIITRILLERFTVSRPHPWGLLVTFIELLRKPIYNLWSYEFVSYTPEIRKLFEWIAHTPIINQHPDSTTTTTTNKSQSSSSSSHQTVLPSKGN